MAITSSFKEAVFALVKPFRSKLCGKLVVSLVYVLFSISTSGKHRNALKYAMRCTTEGRFYKVSFRAQ